MTDEQNPRAAIGGNLPPIPALISGEEDFSAVVTAWLEDNFKDQPRAVLALLEEARDLPREISDDAGKEKYMSVIKRLRDQAKALEGIHAKEKTPYLRGGQAVDQFFFGLIDKLAKRAKNNQPGAFDVLSGRLTAYDTRKLEEERRRRRLEAEEAERVARAAAAKAEAERVAAEEARLAAERARKPETKEQKAGVAAAVEQTAAAAQVEATVAGSAATEAHIATLAKPADIMRTRGADGTLGTMATEKFAEIVDEAKLDYAKLWPFIGFAEKEKALRAWAKSTGHKPGSMEGASIGDRPKSRVR